MFIVLMCCGVGVLVKVFEVWVCGILVVVLVYVVVGVGGCDGIDLMVCGDFDEWVSVIEFCFVDFVLVE